MEVQGFSLKNRELFALKRLVRLRKISEQDIDGFILLFRDHEHPDSAVVRQIPADARLVLLHCVISAA